MTALISNALKEQTNIIQKRKVYEEQWKHFWGAWKKHPSVADFHPQRCLIWIHIKRGSINLCSNHWLAIFYSLYFIIYRQSPSPVYNETKINPLYVFFMSHSKMQQPVKSQDRLFSQLLTSITLLYSWMNIKRQGKKTKNWCQSYFRSKVHIDWEEGWV